MDALIFTKQVESGSDIRTQGILPSYYDSAPNIIVSSASSIKVMPAPSQPSENDSDEDSEN